MNQGVIRALKAKYRSLAIRKLISALEKKEPIPIISILPVMTSQTRPSPDVSE